MDFETCYFKANGRTLLFFWFRFSVLVKLESFKCIFGPLVLSLYKSLNFVYLGGWSAGTSHDICFNFGLVSAQRKCVCIHIYVFGEPDVCAYMVVANGSDELGAQCGANFVARSVLKGLPLDLHSHSG